MDEFELALVEYYTPTELVELLGLTTTDIIVSFEERINERYDDICEDCGYTSN